MLPRFFAPHAHQPEEDVDLSGEESRHATRVLRLGPGDHVAIFNGRGQEWRARVLSAARTGLRVRLEAPIASAREPRVVVTLLQAVLKGDHMDAVIRDATMMGVRAVQPVLTAHTVSAGAASGSKAVDRWMRVAVASAKQCRRAFVPTVRAAQPLAEALGDSAGSGFARRIVLAEPAHGASEDDADGGMPETAVLAVGPEGGWSADELLLFSQSGFRPLTLGALTLRADAAAIVALSVLRERWGDL